MKILDSAKLNELGNINIKLILLWMNIEAVDCHEKINDKNCLHT